jgi:nitroreductase
MKSFLELARSRRSVRKYTDEPIPGEVLARVLETGRLAPSGNNAQPWRFIVVRDDGIKQRLFEVSGKQVFLLEAPVIIAVVADPKAKMRHTAVHSDGPNAPQIPTMAVIKAVRDAAIAADHMVMAAADMGLGTCWVAKFEQDNIRPVLGVPDDCFVVTLITVGYAAVSSKPSPRYDLREIVFSNQYGRRIDGDEYVLKD